MFYLKSIFLTLPKLSLELHKNIFQSIALYVRLITFLVSKKIKKDYTPWNFNFWYKGRSFNIKLFEGSTDIAALAEIFIDKEYEWDEIFEPKTILDIGAHTGNTSIYFHLLFPKATIYAVEASPKNFQFLEQNVKDIENIHPVFAAVTNQDEDITFYENESSLGSSLTQRNPDAQKVSVPGKKLETLLAELGHKKADVIKVDIEGGEEHMFQEDPTAFAQAYMIEVHADLMAVSAEDFVKKFTSFDCVTKSTGHEERILLYAKQTGHEEN